MSDPEQPAAPAPEPRSAPPRPSQPALEVEEFYLNRIGEISAAAAKREGRLAVENAALRRSLAELQTRIEEAERATRDLALSAFGRAADQPQEQPDGVGQPPPEPATQTPEPAEQPAP